MRRGRPEKSETYEHVEVAGVHVYYRDSMETHFAKITVKTEKLLFFTRLVADGEMLRK